MSQVLLFAEFILGIKVLRLTPPAVAGEGRASQG